MPPFPAVPSDRPSIFASGGIGTIHTASRVLWADTWAFSWFSGHCLQINWPLRHVYFARAVIFPATMAARFQPMNYAPDARDDIGGGNHHPILPLPGSALLDLKFNTPPYGGPPRGSIPGAISDTDRREKSSNRGLSPPDDPDIPPPYRTYFDNTFDSPQR